MSKKRHYNGINGRRNSFGTLERRGSGRFLARWWIADRNGRRFRKSQMLDASNVDAARKQLAELTKINAFDSTENALLKTKAQLEGVQKDRMAYLEAQTAMKLEDLWDEYGKTRAGRKPSDETRRMYECQVNRFIKWVKENHPEVTEIREVSRAIARGFSEWLLSLHSNNTHNKYIILLSAIWEAIKAREEESGTNAVDVCVKDAHMVNIGINPWSSIEKEPVAIRSRRELSFDEIDNLYNFADGEMRILVAVGICTGLRLKDALLSWENIDMQKGVIRIRPHKVEKKMALRDEWIRIPILPDLHDLFSEIPVENRHGYVMPTLTKIYNRSSALLSYRISKIFKASGIETQGKKIHGRKCVNTGFHSLRHTFVSIAVRHGIPMATVQNLVGHASEAMTKHYLHLSDASIKEEMKSFPRLLRASCAAVGASVKGAVIGGNVG